MTLRDERPVRRCAVKGCPFLGRWDEGGTCREHTVNPLTDRPGASLPTLAETWAVDDLDDIGGR